MLSATCRLLGARWGRGRQQCSSSWRLLLWVNSTVSSDGYGLGDGWRWGGVLQQQNVGGKVAARGLVSYFAGVSMHVLVIRDGGG